MNNFVTGFQEFIHQVAGMNWSDYLDIIIVAYLLYRIDWQRGSV